MPTLRNALLLAGFAAFLAACATSYRKPILGLGGGFTDKRLGPDTWRVKAGANAYSRRGYGGEMAMYRAAELARRAGFPFFQVLRSNFFTASYSIGYGAAAPTGGHYGGDAGILKIRGVHDRAAPLACEEADTRRCGTFSVEQVMADLAPRLGLQKH